MKTFTIKLKPLLLIVAALTCVSFLNAERIPPEKAEQAAANFLTSKFESSGENLLGRLSLEVAFVYSLDEKLNSDIKSTDQALFYVFNSVNKKGFVMLSADDAVLPVLAYSLEQSFSGENLPDAVVYMLDVYARQINYVIANDVKPGQQTVSYWADLMSGADVPMLKSVSSVNPLLSTTWNQSPYYNDLCPYDNTYGELTVSGCVATAMSQIMKFWEHPSVGVGYHSYNHDTYGTLSANFGAQNYNWAAMPGNLSSPNEAVAIITQHCGVAVDMDYGVSQTGGSAAYVIENASPVQHCVEYSLKAYFDYSSDMQGIIRQQYDNATWLQLLKTDLDAGRPIQYAGFGAGGGHTWVCDGYDNSNLFHMNWGWGGVYDGYYSLDDLSPGVGGAGGGSGSFTSGQQALIGIEPAGGGGGGGGGSAAIDLRAYSGIVIQPDPVNFTGPFDVSLDIANFDDDNFSGSFAAVLFNSEGDFVDFIEEKTNITLESEYYNSFTFSTTGLLATPGAYYIGIYYKPDGGEYLIIGPGDYSNYAATTIVGPDNDIQMYSQMEIDPLPVVSGEPFEIVFDIANFGSIDFTGDISADLYDKDGNYLEELVSGAIELGTGFYGTLTLSIQGVNVEAGSYILAIWDKPGGGEWQLVGSEEFPNPVTILIADPLIQPDAYEDNNEQGLAYNFPLSFSGTSANVITDGSNIHEGNDLDFYKVDLPAGSQYRFNARVHDSNNSGNGNQYTNDVLWAYIVGNQVSDAFDDVAPDLFVIEGGQPVYFIVSNYYQGNRGTYLLDMQIEKGVFGVNEISADNIVKLYPNPASGEINLEVKNWDELGLPADIEILDMDGKVVSREFNIDPLSNRLKLSVHELQNGHYILRVIGKEKQFKRQILKID